MRNASRSTVYLLVILGLAVINLAVLSAAGASIGLSLDAFVHGAPEAAILNMVALVALLWPGVAVTVRALDERKPFAWTGIPLYALAVLMFMAGYFGKPFHIGFGADLARVLPPLLFTLMAAWVMVELAPERLRARAGLATKA